MEYNTAYHLHCEIELPCGRHVILEELQQRQTYAGLLEGTPFATSNNRNIQRALDIASTRSINVAKPYLIDPVRRDYLREPGDMDDVHTFDGRAPEWLPMVRCIGSFKSFPPARNTQMHGSHLVIVWYQAEFGPPIDDIAVSQIKAINWNSVAADFEY